MVWKNGNPKICELAVDVLTVTCDPSRCFGVVLPAPRYPQCLPMPGQHRPAVPGLLDMYLHNSVRTEGVPFLSQLV